MNFGALSVGANIYTGFGLLGFLVFVIFLAYYRRLKSTETTLKQLPLNQRSNFVDSTLSRYGMDTTELSADQKYDLIKLELEKKSSRLTQYSIITAIVFVTVFIISSIFPKGPEEHRTPRTEILESAYNIGLRAIDYGRYSKEEDDRFDNAIKNANTIDIIVYNGDGLFSSDRFSSLFRSFFQKDSASMRVLFAKRMSLFSTQNLDMTLKMYNPPVDYTADAASVDRNLTRLRGWSNDPHKLQYKYYETEFRLPIIIIDNNYCIVTVRLPPDEGQNSIRLEVDNETHQSGQFFQSCLNHFARMWALSSDSPALKKVDN